MDPITQQTTLAAAGGKKDPLYVDDVFSTFLYAGNDANDRDIANGIDLDGEGGMVWIKRRNGDHYHCLFDTERGVDSLLHSNTADPADTSGGGITAFNSDGFTIDNTSSPHINDLNDTLASWTFRKAPGFFDVVTYTGTGSARTIAHSLGSVPGMIIIKSTSSAYDWRVYHRFLGKDYYGGLNSTTAFQPESGSGYVIWNNTEPTSSVFSVGTAATVNANGVNYVAYIFAHDDASFGTDGDESIIKCGSYTGTGAEQFIDLGFEPQFLLHKRTEGSGSWKLFDNMRGWADTAQARLFAESSEIEATSSGDLTPTSTGFREPGVPNTSTWVYMAIRRPNKPPEAATEVFAMDTYGGTTPTPPIFNASFPVDLGFFKSSNSTQSWRVGSRLTSGQRLEFNDNGGAVVNSSFLFDYQNGWYFGTGTIATTYSWMFKRAPGFFDVVTYTGTESNRTVNHNLGVVPEMMIVKKTNSSAQWAVYHSATGNTGITQITSSGTYTPRPLYWNSTTPTSTQFSLGTEGDINSSADKFSAYLFATLPGISKVGSYTGTGSDINVDCGFTNGARFVLIKRTDSTADWFLYDTTRGISSGNDPYLKVNQNEIQVTSTDYIDPLSSGFIANANSADINASGGTYIFLAIA